MHSRIFLYSKDKKVNNSTISSNSFNNHSFTNVIADYVVDSNLQEDINWLKAIFKDLPLTVDDKNNFIIAQDDFKNQYFNRKYNDFINLISEIKDTISLDNFLSEDICIAGELWELNNLYNDKYSFYFCDEDMNMLTMDEFIRKMELNCKYYINKSFDYHF